MSDDTTPGHTTPGHTTPGHTTPGHTTPGHTTPGHPTPGHPEPKRRFGTARPKVPPFARYVGTSAWRKDRRRARAYAMYLAAADRARQQHGTPGA